MKLCRAPARTGKKNKFFCSPILRAEPGWGSFTRTGLRLCRSEEPSPPRTALRLSPLSPVHPPRAGRELHGLQTGRAGVAPPALSLQSLNPERIQVNGWTRRGHRGAEGSGSGRAASVRSGLAGAGPLPLLAAGLAAPPCPEMIDGPLGRWLPSAGPVSLQPRAGAQKQFPCLSVCLSVCLSAAGLSCVLPPSVPIPFLSFQPNKGREEKSSPGSVKWKATLFLFDDSANSSGIPPEIKARISINQL
ncbi:uncharacterized protein LOC131575533 [Poecile atricapillus]|uniref:uncharacterized protein LOC131575533 n=1 Tax=Poecile atricapillus TaxID=48891 RepID=UPI0027389BDD|nr:uncharacterized protein LOC131575533 [Poecile atricapillus]